VLHPPPPSRRSPRPFPGPPRPPRRLAQSPRLRSRSPCRPQPAPPQRHDRRAH
jgi:hypothetical protein